MDVFIWSYEHWRAVGAAIIVATGLVAIVRLVRYCPTIDDDTEL